MAVAVIPTSTNSEDSDYTQRTSLSGKDYIFHFIFNTREEKWYMDLADQDNLPIVSGVKVVLNNDLLFGVTDERRPYGLLIAVDTTGSEIDPGLEDFGSRVRLTYTPGEDL